MSETPITIQNALESYVKNYGPFAFGIITLLILWFSIVKPQMDRQALDWDGQYKVTQQLFISVEALNKVTQQLTVSMETAKQTNATLEKMSGILDEITRRLK